MIRAREQVMMHVLLTAKTHLCWVYDLELGRSSMTMTDQNKVEEGEERASDFHGSLLHCLINGLEHSAHSEQDSSRVRGQLQLAIKWKRPDALHWLLRRHSRRMQRVVFQALVDDLLHTAIETHNEKAVIKLLEYGASLHSYAFGRGDTGVQVEIPREGETDEEEEGETDEAGEQVAADAAVRRKMRAHNKMQEAANLWAGLIRACKSDPSTRHVYVFLKGVQTTFRQRAVVGIRGCGLWATTGIAHKIRESRNLVLRTRFANLDASDLDLDALKGWEAFDSLEWDSIFSQLSEEEKSQLDAGDKSEGRHRSSTFQQLVLLQVSTT